MKRFAKSLETTALGQPTDCNRDRIRRRFWQETCRETLDGHSGASPCHFGKKAIIYTTVDFHRENIDGHFRDHQFWLRSVAAHPGDIYPNHPWSFWQYTGTGKMPGIEGDVDINAFAGTRAEWREWLSKHGS